MATIAETLNLALQHHEAGRLQEAEALYRQILQAQPNHPDALHLLGVIAHHIGRNDVAVELIGKAITVNPTVAEYHNNIGEAYRALGLSEEAVACYRQALTLRPAYAEAYNNLGAVLHSQGKLEEAAAHYRQALALKPDYEQPYVNLGKAQSEQGKVEEAVASYQRALAVRPNDGVRVLMATALPVIADSRDHLIEARRRFLEQLSELARENLSIGDPVTEIGMTSFYLAYQGCNDREPLDALSRLYERACPSLKYIAAHCQAAVAPLPDRKIKVGFISRMIGNHTVTAVLMRGLIAQLSRRLFSVSVFSFPHERNSNCEDVSSCADHVVFLPPMLDVARRQIAHEQLDILCYVDIGMDPLTYFLAFSRLAPIQCATWQHPVTTGIRTVDYFISSQVLEPDDFDAQYSEKLVRFKHLPTFYYRPAMPAPVKSRKELGLDEEKTLYLCPQSLFKLHPDFDELIGGILDADQRGEVILLEASQEHFSELLLRRLRRTIPEVVNRIRVLPRLKSQDFVHLLAVADVLLDPLHWSGGVTTLDALALGTPIVTLPGDFMRGRVTYACYKQMGVMDCVATTKEQYIGLAVRLGTDPAYRALIKSKILSANHVLYENADAVRDLERFFVEAVETARCAADERQHRLRATIAETLNLALQHHQAGRLQEAEALYRQILQTQPNHPDALHWLGLIAHQVGRHDVAIDYIRQAILQNPGVPDFHNNLGEAYRASGQFEAASACFHQALVLRPDFSEAHNNLGNIFRDQRKFDEAIACYHRALVARPDFAEAHNNLGVTFRDQGRLEEAIICFRQALTIRPGFPMALNLLGVTLQDQGRLEEAVASLRQALTLTPDFPEALNHLGVALQNLGQLKESAACYHKALALRQDFAEAHNNLGHVLSEQGKLDEAVACYERAMKFKPDLPEAYMNLGNARKDQGQAEEAVRWYRRALEIKPDYARAHSNLLFVMCYSAAYSSETIAAEHRKWNDVHAQPYSAQVQAHPHDRNPRRKLRVGYVSGDFLRHPIGLWIEPLLATHSRTDLEIFGYSTVVRADGMTERLRALTDAWRVIAGLDDDAAAQLIKDDRIDILVDLSGHSKNNRLLVFARKPAPVQVTYLGSLTTTGLATMDYKLSDRYLTPPAGSEWFAEHVVRLPGCFICYRAPAEAPPVAPLPAAGNGYVTFGSFNNLAKVTPHVVAWWAKILHAVPKARLLLKDRTIADPGQQDKYRQLFEQQGIDSGRLDLRPATPFPGHLAEYGHVDIALDPFPYGGCYTSCEALWMGVPVVTLGGSLSSGRYGVSLLSNLGCKDWIAKSHEEYVAKAVTLAKDRKRLAALRVELRPRMAASPLCDAEALARGVEKAYRQMWKRWCTG